MRKLRLVSSQKKNHHVEIITFASWTYFNFSFGGFSHGKHRYQISFDLCFTGFFFSSFFKKNKLSFLLSSENQGKKRRTWPQLLVWNMTGQAVVLKQETSPFLLPVTGKAHIFVPTVHFRILSTGDVLDCRALTTDSHNLLSWWKGKFSPADLCLLGPSLIAHRKGMKKK